MVSVVTSVELSIKVFAEQEDVRKIDRTGRQAD